MKPIIKGHIASFINHTFQVFLVTYLIMLLSDQIWKGFVSNYLNLNYVLIAVIVLGILDVFSQHDDFVVSKTSYKDYIFIAFLGIIAFIIIKIKTSSLGNLSYLISIIASILIILLSILILNDNEDKDGR